MSQTIKRRTASKKGPRAKSSAHEDRRVQIIERCAELFDAGGYHRATMEMVAEEVGLSKPTLYHYFRSKSDIPYAIHQKHIAALIDGLDAQRQRGASNRAALVSACRHILDEIAEHPGYVRAFFEHYRELDEPKRGEIRARRAEYFDKLCGIIRAGVASGEFRDCNVELAVYGFLGMASWAYQWYPSMASKISTQRLAETLCDNYLKGINKPARK